MSVFASEKQEMLKELCDFIIDNNTTNLADSVFLLTIHLLMNIRCSLLIVQCLNVLLVVIILMA